METINAIKRGPAPREVVAGPVRKKRRIHPVGKRTPPLTEARSSAQSQLLSSLELAERMHPPIRLGHKQVATKEVILYKGDPASHLFEVVSGKVKVSAPSEDGKEIIFGILGAGDLFGEMGMLDGGKHTASVTALESTELAVLDRQAVLRCMETCPAMALKLLTILCRRLRQAGEMAEDLSFLPLSVRLAKKLTALAEAYGEPTSKGVRIGFHLCQQELANLVATSRESINKQLAVWQAQGLVAMEHGCLVICRPTDLAALVDQQVSRGGTRKAVGPPAQSAIPGFSNVQLPG